MDLFDHEKLIVYQRSLEFIDFAYAAINRIPRGASVLKEQLFRSASSIPSNIAEGVGKRSLIERKTYYDHARGSALESASHLELVRRLKWSPTSASTRAKPCSSRS